MGARADTVKLKAVCVYSICVHPSRKMTHSRFDCVPVDVLKTVLFPYLDWHGRLGVNLCLPVHDRIMKRLPVEKLLRVPLGISASTLKHYFESFEFSWGPDRNQVLYKFLSTVLPRHLIITQYYSKFRAVMEGRLTYFSNTEHYDYRNVDAEFKQKMVDACANIRRLLDTVYTVKMEMNVPGITGALPDNWSPVDAGPCIVTEFWGDQLKRHGANGYETVKIPQKPTQPISKSAVFKKELKRQAYLRWRQKQKQKEVQKGMQAPKTEADFKYDVCV